jgi:hypothetical protein
LGSQGNAIPSRRAVEGRTASLPGVVKKAPAIHWGPTGGFDARVGMHGSIVPGRFAGDLVRHNMRRRWQALCGRARAGTEPWVRNILPGREPTEAAPVESEDGEAQASRPPLPVWEPRCSRATGGDSLFPCASKSATQNPMSSRASSSPARRVRRGPVDRTE